MRSIAILGAGPMGLSAAYYALRKGYKVEIFEAAPFAGGMASHFDFNGVSIEKFYHFICKSDIDLFQLLDELEIGDQLRWNETSMGYFIDNKLYEWGHPLALLKFDRLNLLEKIRYGLNAFLTSKRKNFNSIEGITAKDWLTSWIGKRPYELMWEKLLKYKFYEYQNEISASWIATRMKRVANSRKSIFQEQLGYLNGGSQTLIDKLSQKIIEKGGRVHLSSPVTKVLIEEGKVKGIKLNDDKIHFDTVFSTIPTPYIQDLLEFAPEKIRKKYNEITNIGVVCVIIKLAKSLTPHFWLNINDTRFEIPGLVEFSNLRILDGGENIIYIPYYMPITNKKFSNNQDFFFKETLEYLKIINPELSENDVIDFSINKLKYAQPVCDSNFLKKIPNIESGIDNLYIADTSFYYPEDRGISESIKLAKHTIENIIK